MGIFGVLFPGLNSWLHSVEQTWLPNVIVMVFLLARISIQRMGKKLSGVIGADKMPCYIWFAACSYEMNMAMVLAGNFPFSIAGELVTINALDNLYHIWSLKRNENKKEVQQYIASQLMLRQL